MAVPSYYGKYRAQVVDVSDPEQRGRIRVMCPKVLGDAKSAWCEPCVPVAGDKEGDFWLPAKGEMVWIEFEEGNPNKPIFVGSWYSKSKSPKSDYGDAPNERILSFKGVKISMRAGKCVISAGGSSVSIQSGVVAVTAGGVTCNLTSSSLSTLKSHIGG